jgi:putative addiction module component (TIGR02574 family)
MAQNSVFGLELPELIQQLLKLDDQSRRTIGEALLESVPDADDGDPLTDAQKAELARRLADEDANPDDESPWEDVKARLLAGL